MSERLQLIAESTTINTMLSKLKKGHPQRTPLVQRNNEIIQRLTELKCIDPENKNSEIISDHALVRWLQRRHGIDIARLRELMLTDSLKAAILSGEKYFSDGRVVYIIYNGSVQTVIPVSV